MYYKWCCRFFTCSAESTEGKGESEDLAFGSGKFKTMHHPLALRMYYYCCSSGKRTPLTIQESEIFPKLFLGLLFFFIFLGGLKASQCFCVRFCRALVLSSSPLHLLYAGCCSLQCSFSILGPEREL